MKTIVTVALAFISIGLVDEFNFRIILTIGWFVAFKYLVNRNDVLVSRFAIVTLLVLSIPLNSTHLYQGHITTIKNNYFIVQDGISKVIVYYQGEVHYDDLVVIDEDIKPISSYNNFNLASYASWAKGNNIVGQISEPRVEVVKAGNTIRRYIFAHNVKYGNDWINSLLFGKAINSDSDNDYLIMQCGLHVSFVAWIIQITLALWFKPQQSQIITIIIVVVLAAIFHFPYAYLVTLVNLITKYLCTNNKKQTAWQIIILCLIRPYYVKSLAFLVPIGLKMLRVYTSSYKKITQNFYLMFVQLLFNGSCNLLNTLFFPIIRNVAGVFYLLALLCCILPITINISNVLINFLSLVDRVNILSINGQLSVLSFYLLMSLLLNYQIKGHKKYLYYVVAVLLVCVNKSLITPFYTLTQLDVGQGDCCLITSPFSNHGLLIDTGGSNYKDIGKDIVLPYLRANTIKSVDVIITHSDTDHSLALKTIQENFQVNNVYDQKVSCIEFNGIKILNPLAETYYGDINDDSLISYFSIGEFVFLYLADISSRVESDLVDQNLVNEIDVLKVPHHGSISGDSDKLLTRTKPVIALISAGKNNYYDHPNEVVVDRLNRYQVEILQTNTSSAIKLYVLNHLMLFQLANKQIGIYYK